MLSSTMSDTIRIIKRIITVFFISFLLSLGTLHASDDKYIFYLHNMFVELYDLKTKHPEYGRAEYKEILAAFRKAGLKVISEKRKKDTDVKEYAQKVVAQIEELINKGVPPNNITVVGASKGGYIAQYVSTYLKNPNINYVFIGCYKDEDLKRLPEIQFCGNILSIYEKSDTTFGTSVEKRIKNSTLPIPHFKEIKLHTGMRHGFLYHPLPEWVLPTIQWAKGNYGTLVIDETRKKIENILTSRPEKPFNGIMLIKEGNNTVYYTKSGFADMVKKSKFSDSSRFFIGSVSKQMTAALLLLEYEKGHLKLTDTIGKYLPDLNQTWKDSITIYQLITHTHGIVSLHKPNSRLAFKPGSKMDYERGNAWGYSLLGKIIEKTSGKSFAQLSAELFARCGMKNSFHPDYSAHDGHKNLAKGYMTDKNGTLKHINIKENLMMPPEAGGIISTALDLALWNEHFFGGKILKPETYTLLTTIQPHIIRQHGIWGATEYGLGITILDKEHIVQYGQTGYNTGYISMNYYFPETKTSAILLQNIIYHPGEKAQDEFYYHVQIIEMLREALKTGKEIIENKNFTDGNSSTPYKLIYPNHEDLTKKYPLLMYVHPDNANNHDQFNKEIQTAFMDSERRMQYPAYIAIPYQMSQPNSSKSVADDFKRNILELIHHIIETKNIDKERIYLAGFSLKESGIMEQILSERGLCTCIASLHKLYNDTAGVSRYDVPIRNFQCASVAADTMKGSLQNGGESTPAVKKQSHDECSGTIFADTEVWKWIFEQRKHKE